MQAREATYLEEKLGALFKPVQEYCQDNTSEDPLAVLVSHLLCADTAECDDPTECLNTEPLLKAGRAYFALLTENDRLPPGEQLTAQELALPRALLMDFFLGRSDIQQRAQEVLALIERKFSERAFQQATILLQLFETDQATRIQNERKLFYEDMIQRLGVRRRHPLSADEVDRIKAHFGDIVTSLGKDSVFKSEDDKPLADMFERHSADEPIVMAGSPGNRRKFVAAETRPSISLEEALGEEGKKDGDGAQGDAFTPLLKSLSWLAEQHQIHFCVQVRHPGQILKWEKIAQGGDPDKGAAMLRQVPPLRWRLVTDFPDMSFMETLCRHMTAAAVREQLRTMTKACYFVLLAVGDTGLEGYIDTYFGWLQDQLGVDGTAFIDRLHRESTLGEKTLQETLDAIFDEFFAQSLAGMPYTFTEQQLLDGLHSFITQMHDADLGEVAPGFFDLGGFVIDHLLKVPYPALEFPFRIHRIV